MSRLWTRRGVMGVMAAAGATAFVRPAAADGLLAKVKAAGVLKIGIADNIPWSKLNPDGSLTGIAPLTVIAVAKQLGIPKIEATVGTYGQLVPGLLAGRWDMVGASMTISPERCAQVLFVDPFYRGDESQYVGYLAGAAKEKPKSFVDVVKMFDKVGINSGSAELPYWQRAMETAGKKVEMVQFTDPQLAVEGLKTGRVPVITNDSKTMQLMQKQQGGFEIAPVDSGHPTRGSAGAFRKEDQDFRVAFVAEQRELKKSGEIKKILAEFGYEYDERFMNLSGDEACKL
ncbi:MAG: transporter substrate-binding domain-containing protein [Dehalococcoidia bacterium]